jgi:hypothetical protein
MMAETELCRRIAKRKPLISTSNRLKCAAWVQQRRGWTGVDWRQVVWSDESRFAVWQDGDRLVWRTVAEKYRPECLVPTVKHGGGGIMVWGCFSWYGLGPCVVVEGNLNSAAYRALLEEHLLPFLSVEAAAGHQPLFQQDNAPCHVSASTRAWMAAKGIEAIPWPAQSPDLNPIETLWGLVKKALKNRYPAPKTTRDLAVAVVEEWKRLSMVDFRRVVASMPRRALAVALARGNPTKY